jgi:predicted site-specific integrase-resolvase
MYRSYFNCSSFLFTQKGVENNMKKEIKAVAYARVSSKEQAEKELSIPAQLEAIRNYCNKKVGSLSTNT